MLIAFLQGSKVEYDFMSVMLTRLTITGSTMGPRSIAEEAAVRDALRREIWPAFESGRLQTHWFATFPLAQADVVHELMESSRRIGKIVLQVRP